MDFDTLALRPPEPGSPQPRPSLPDKPAEVLAALMDFSGGVALAELLVAPVPSGRSHPDAGRNGYDLQERVQAQLDAISTRALQRLQRERRLESDIATSELLAVVAQLTGPTGLGPQVAKRVASELRKRVGWQLGASLRQAQVDLARLRSNIAAELRSLGPRADQLERIDAALQTSLQHKLIELYDRLLRAAEQNFDRACYEACVSLPKDVALSEPELASWLAPHGWLARDRERCELTIHAFCVHLRRGLEGLVLAAIEVEVGS